MKRIFLPAIFLSMCAIQLKAQTCSTPNFTANATFGSAAFFVAMGDLNGDGKVDLAVASIGFTHVSVFLNNGNGTFGAPTNYNVGSGLNTIAIGDLNGDGNADLAVPTFQGNNVAVLLNNGNGTFATAVYYTVGSNPVGVAIGDINSDGKPDLAVANNGSDNVSVLLNNGSGAFAAPVNYAVGLNPGRVAIGDLNGDGKVDLAVTNSGSNSNTISVLLNNGTGTFATAVNYVTGQSPRSIIIAELNGDGRLDLAVANGTSDNVSVLLNNGGGTFAAPVNYAAGITPGSIATGDLNGDGISDLAVANQGRNNQPSRQVSVFLNNGNGTFGAAVNFTIESLPYSVAIGDVNSDGKSDLVVAASSGVIVLINNCTASTLPVTLINLKAYQKTGGIQVEWTTLTELNSDRFEVEKSIDGQNFTRIGVVTARGNSSTAVNYKLFDPSAQTGANFYRIKSLDKDGSVQYSNILKVNSVKVTGEISIYPNPVVNNTFNLQFTNLKSGRYTVMLTNKAGQQLYSSVIEHNGGSATQKLRINTAFPKGSYNVQVISDDVRMTRRLIKN